MSVLNQTTDRPRLGFAILLLIGGLSWGVLGCSDNGSGSLPSGNQNQELDAGADASPDAADASADTTDDVDSTDPDADFDADTGDDAADADADADFDAGQDDAGQDDDGPEEIFGPCGPMLDLGTIELGSTTVEIDFDYFDNTLSTSCASSSGDVAVLMLRTPYATTAEMSVNAQGKVAAEIRRGGCDDDVTIYGCDDEKLVEPMAPGMIHFLVLESLDPDAAMPVEIEFELQEYPPCPGENGQKQCLDDATIEICDFFSISPDVPRRVSGQCPGAACDSSMSICDGNHCSSPIMVTDSFHWNGWTLFFNNWHSRLDEIVAADDAEKEPTCLMDGETSDDLNFPVSGRELVFHLPDVQQGDMVHVDVEAEDPDEVLILIRDACDNEAECMSVSTAEEAVEFEVLDDDDLYIFIDTREDDREEQDSFVDISIEIEDS